MQSSKKLDAHPNILAATESAKKCRQDVGLLFEQFLKNPNHRPTAPQLSY